VTEAPEDVDAIVARADAVMYEAKRNRNLTVLQQVYPEPREQPVAPASRRRRTSGDIAS
jgi:hypothetical protein